MILFPTIPFVWPFLLIASIICAIKVSTVAGVLFSLQIVAFQLVKYADLPQQQIIFLGVLTLFACASYTYSAKIPAITFVLIALVYVSFFFGMIGQSPKVIIADILFIAGLFCSGYFGSDGGILARSGAVFHYRSGDISALRSGILQKEKKG